MPQGELFSENDPREHYELLQQVGSGSYGTVHQAYSMDREEIVAAKIMAIQDDEEYQSIIKEVVFLQKLSVDPHPNIVNYLESYYSKQLKELWIVMEFCGAGSVTDLMRDRGRVLFEEEAAYVIKSLLQGLVFLKSQKILHRDVKGGNLLVTEEGLVKVADFGVSSQLTNTFSKRNTYIGTPYWMAPEVFQRASYSYPADVWSTGITLVELLEGHPPYANLHPVRAMMVIPNAPPYSLRGQRSEASKKVFSDDVVDFLDKCLQKDPEKRATAEQLLEHPFLKRATDLENLIKNRYAANLVEDVEKRNSMDIARVSKASLDIAEDDPENQYDSGTIVQQSVAAYDAGTVVHARKEEPPVPEDEDSNPYATVKRVRKPVDEEAYATVKRLQRPQVQVPEEPEKPAEEACNGM